MSGKITSNTMARHPQLDHRLSRYQRRLEGCQTHYYRIYSLAADIIIPTSMLSSS
jgi:hypothetical protein